MTVPSMPEPAPLSGEAARALADAIKEEAVRLGFARAGIAPADPLGGEESGFFDRWLARQYHGEMGYLARDPAARKDARTLLPGAKSVVAVAMLYETAPPSEPEPDGDDPRGRVSNYAWGEDYHDVLKEKLGKLLAYVTARRPGTRGKACVDSSPVLDRAYAHRAGIGFWGKNTMILAEDLGSYFFLGELLLDVALPFDSPVPDRCGTCRRCLDACPTGAFAGPFDLDARRCLSYLTIELRGPFPDDAARESVRDWLFGCDVCQAVCPWNRGAPLGADPAFAAKEGRARPSLPALLAMRSDAEWKAAFGGGPMSRAKRRGLLRNAAAILGSTRDARGVPALAGALGDADPVIREEAAHALGRIGGSAAAAALGARAAIETDAKVAAAISRARESLS